MRRYWLSFADADRPAGEQFLGACVVEVTDIEAQVALKIVQRQFPNAKPGAEWLAAASMKAHYNDCNPGGEIQALDITDSPYPEGVEVPLYTLMDRAELQRRGIA